MDSDTQPFLRGKSEITLFDSLYVRFARRRGRYVLAACFCLHVWLCVCVCARLCRPSETLAPTVSPYLYQFLCRALRNSLERIDRVRSVAGLRPGVICSSSRDT